MWDGKGSVETHTFGFFTVGGTSRRVRDFTFVNMPFPLPVNMRIDRLRIAFLKHIYNYLLDLIYKLSVADLDQYFSANLSTPGVSPEWIFSVFLTFPYFFFLPVKKVLHNAFSTLSSTRSTLDI